ncbi:MAG: DUF937 domain-containing protein [Gemmatimonadota bacterium]
MSLLDMLQSQLAGEPAAQIGQRLGTDQAGAQKAIGAALPALMAALAGNASRKDGANSLASALDRDHDGGVLDDLTGFLSRGDTKDGGGILKHALGGRRQAVETEVAKQTGLDASAVAGLLPMLAPLVMGALGREKRQKGLDLGGLAGMLSGEGKRAREMAPGALGLLGGLLDDEGDGLGAGDLADAGKGLLGKLLGGQK